MDQDQQDSIAQQNSIAQLEQALDRLLLDQLDDQTIVVDAPYLALQKKIDLLRQQHQQLKAYTVALSQGDMDVTPPNRKNYLASGIKQLHAQLSHLTWQTQCIARGDYQQTIDFMGEFSAAFNTMTQQLNQRESHIKAQRDVMMTIFDQIDPILIVDAKDHDNTLYVNQKARQSFGIEVSSSLRDIRIPFIQSMIAQNTYGTKKQIYDLTSDRWFSVTVTQFPWENDEQAILYHCVDITSHKSRELLLERAASIDTLTTLYNRGAFDLAFEREWKVCLRQKQPISMMMIDIDHFKTYNDNYGHLHGDQCLIFIAKILKESILRSGDFVARFGGEEFVVFLPFTAMHGALALAENIRSAIDASQVVSQIDPNIVSNITVSIGVSSMVPLESVSRKQLLQAADQALYQAKESGRNKVCSILQ